MRMVASSAKSTGRRRAICSGLQAFAHRRSFRGPCRRLFQDTTGPGTGARSEPQRRQTTVPRHRFLTPRCAQASPRFGRRAARSACHCAVVARYARPPLRVGVAPQLSGDCRCHSPEPASDLLHGVALNAKERDLPPAPQTRDTDHRAASPVSPNIGWRHAPCLPEPASSRWKMSPPWTSCSYRLRDTDTDRSITPLAVPAAIAARNRRSSSRPATNGRPVRTSAPAQNDPSAVFEYSPHQLPSRCCTTTT